MAKNSARKPASVFDVISDAAHAAADDSIHVHHALAVTPSASGTPEPVAAPGAPAEAALDAEATSEIVAALDGAAGSHTVSEAAAMQLRSVRAIAEATAIAPADFVATTTATEKAAAKSALEQTMKSAEEFVSFGQGNLEAMMKCGQIWAAGLQDLSKSFAVTAQAQLDQTVSTWKAMAGVKSVREAMDLQSTLARSSMEVVMSETGKLTDASMKLAEQTFAPISERVSLAVEKFGRTA